MTRSKYKAAAPAKLEQRSEQRHPVLLQRVSIRPSKMPPREAMLVELSVYGCRLMITSRMKAGARLILRIADRDPIVATAIWSDGKHVGCRFDQAIDSALFRALTLEV